MLLRGNDWGHVLNASGARGFAGEGYWFHPLLRSLGLRYDGSTFVSKTTTVKRRRGNMALTEDHRPASLLPDCIVVMPLAGAVLNAVGLSGPGAREVLRMLRWRHDLQKMVVSFMAIESSAEWRLMETLTFLHEFKAFVAVKGVSNVALQLNFSCQNVGFDITSPLVNEVAHVLDLTSDLGIATMVKVNALVPPQAACLMAKHTGCDAIVCSNTIPWGKLPKDLDWKGLFGHESPLKHYGGGGLSGGPLLPVVERWVRRAVDAGISKPVVAGGGVLSEYAADLLIDAGASAIELGSVAILRPWRVAAIIAHVNRRLRSDQPARARPRARTGLTRRTTETT